MARKPKAKAAKQPVIAPLTAPPPGDWPADRVERRPVASLVPYARNSRTHSPQQVAQIAEAIRQWGWTTPVLVDEADGIIAGHGRVLAAKDLGLVDVPVMVARGWTVAQKRAYVIADNRIAQSGGWDQDLLKLELCEIKSDGFDLDLTGFTVPELDCFLRVEALGGMTDADDVPDAAPGEPVVTQPGDIWLLGPHRLICGDSTGAGTIARLMDGKLADLCFTSPPYGQQRDYKTSIHDWDALMRGVFSVLPLKQSAQVLVNLGMIHRDNEWIPYWEGWIEWMRTSGWRRFGWYVWDQGPGLPGDWNGRLAPAHEFVFHFNRVSERPRKTKDKLPGNMRAKGPNEGALRGKDGNVPRVYSPETFAQPAKIPDSVVRIMRHKGGLGDAGSHPAVFPVALAAEFITAFSDPDDLVFEPFCGSGTQLIAAHQNQRVCHACEIAPAYVDVAVKRWQDFTGQRAVLEDGRQSFDVVAATRGENG